MKLVDAGFNRSHGQQAEAVMRINGLNKSHDYIFSVGDQVFLLGIPSRDSFHVIAADRS